MSLSTEPTERGDQIAALQTEEARQMYVVHGPRAVHILIRQRDEWKLAYEEAERSRIVVCDEWNEALARIAVLEAVLREQTDLVDRLCSAVERSENDIGGEGSLTVLGLLGPMNDRARRALTTTLAAVPMTLGENFDQSGRVEVGADDPLAKALRPSPETIAEIERIERGNR